MKDEFKHLHQMHFVDYYLQVPKEVFDKIPGSKGELDGREFRHWQNPFIKAVETEKDGTVKYLVRYHAISDSEVQGALGGAKVVEEIKRYQSDLDTMCDV